MKKYKDFLIDTYVKDLSSRTQPDQLRWYCIIDPEAAKKLLGFQDEAEAMGYIDRVLASAEVTGSIEGCESRLLQAQREKSLMETDLVKKRRQIDALQTQIKALTEGKEWV